MASRTSELMIKNVIAGMSLLLCLAGDPIRMLQAPFVLLQTANQPTEAIR